MKNLSLHLKSTAITVSILVLAFGVCVLLQNTLGIPEHITTTYAFAVFLISLLIPNYFYGIAASFIATIAINYAFTFPYFRLNFTIPTNLVSSITMIVISVMTCTLNNKVKRQEAEKSENEKERIRANLLRAVSHDLRTPLTTIYGSSTALLENMDSLSRTQQEQILRGIKEDSEWLVRMVENLLSVTRIDSGNIKLNKTLVALDELIDSVIVKFRKRYPEQKLELSIPDEVILIPMDPILIEQVLINMLDNAVQHATGMTTLELRVYREGDRVVFETLDDGCGIREDKFLKLFTGCDVATELPADSRKRNAGIGLSVCATIIKVHGGQIYAENRSTGGTRFWFNLNLEDSDHE